MFDWLRVNKMSERVRLILSKAESMYRIGFHTKQQIKYGFYLLPDFDSQGLEAILDKYYDDDMKIIEDFDLIQIYDETCLTLFGFDFDPIFVKNMYEKKKWMSKHDVVILTKIDAVIAFGVKDAKTKMDRLDRFGDLRAEFVRRRNDINICSWRASDRS